MSQANYLAALKPISVQRSRGDGRTVTTKASPQEITEFRSLVSGIAWVGVTHPGAQAAASLFQGRLPEPFIQDILCLNNLLMQLQSQYHPVVFRSGLEFENLKMTTIGDSSLGNAESSETTNKYSQAGFFHLLTTDNRNDEGLVGNCVLLHSRSAKSKRVANSSMSAETISTMNCVESGMFIQTWLLEMRYPTRTTLELINANPRELIKHEVGTDCLDLYSTLISPTFPNPSNRALTLYLSGLREAREKEWIKAWIWTDTEDCIANVLTKLNKDGTLQLEPLTSLLKLSYWEPKKSYRYNNVLCAPVKIPHKPAVVLSKIPKKTHFTKTEVFDLTIDDDQWNSRDEVVDTIEDE